MKQVFNILYLSFVLLLASCSTQPAEVEIVMPTVSVEETNKVVEFTDVNKNLDGINFDQLRTETILESSNNLSNLWTQIPQEKIELFPINYFYECLYDHNGDLWMAGEYGIIQQKQNGEQIWYSILNGLPVNSIRKIVESPANEIWGIGEEGTLVRFDGDNWHNEGVLLPEPYDTRSENPEYDNYILAIDFDSNGNVWIINLEFDIYTQVYGQWINVYYPNIKNFSMFNHPIELDVESEDDMKGRMMGCCAGEIKTIHFDGVIWKTIPKEVLPENDTEIESIKVNSEIHWGVLQESGFDDWPMNMQDVLPAAFGSYDFNNESVFVDSNGTIWLSAYNNFYRKEDAGFQLAKLSEGGNPAMEDVSISIMSIYGSCSEIERLRQSNKDWSYSFDYWRAYYDQKIGEEFYAISGGEITYAASATSIYIINEKEIEQYQLVRDGIKPMVISAGGKLSECDFHKNYSLAANCPFNWNESYDELYEFRFFKKLNDGSLLYANNKLLAKLADGKVKSYLFDTMDIESVAVDADGYIWVLLNGNGLLKFSPDIFDDYQGYNPDNEE